jgi:nicotinamidase/pyrazinamidase
MKPFELLKLSQASAAQAFSVSEVQEYLKSVKNSEQVLWPDHCVQGRTGWELDARLHPEKAHLILRKGTKPLVDSYSAFFENDGTSTGLSGFLRARGIRRVLVCGLAGDYCVLWTVQDAVREGFEVFFDLSLTRFVDFPSGSRQKAEEYLSNFLFH